MTRVEALRHYRHGNELEVRMLGNELLWSDPHYFTVSIEWHRGKRYACFSTNHCSYTCGGITPLQVLHFVKRHFPRKAT
jgi:hypothetical protein